jgi:hypothetical protein
LNHGFSIAEQLELLFARVSLRDHPGNAGSHRIAATALNANELSLVEPDYTSVHRARE